MQPAWRSKAGTWGALRPFWIQQAVDHPVHEETQSDGRVRRWTRVVEEGRWLRVILLPDGETVHNAFFDRGFSR